MNKQLLSQTHTAISYILYEIVKRFKSNIRGMKGIISKSLSMPHNNILVGLYGLYFQEMPAKKRLRSAKRIENKSHNSCRVDESYS